MEINEQQIKEKRTFEAMQKEYVGYQGKFFRIAYNLGNEIIRQGEERSHLVYDDFWGSNENDEIKTLDENSSIDIVGWAFDGLRQGNNLEILVFDEEKKIKVIFDCKKVYEEILGEIESYCPGDWERNIDNLMVLVLKKEAENKQKIREESKDRFVQNKKNILNYLSERWGI